MAQYKENTNKLRELSGLRKTWFSDNNVTTARL